MSFSLTICQAATLGRQKPDLAVLRKHFSTAVKIGGIGPYFNFVPELRTPAEGMAGEYMMYGSQNSLGRGFYLYIDKGFTRFELLTQLPTTTHDLEDLFTMAGALARYLGTDSLLTDQGTTISRAGLAALFGEVARHNNELLKSTASQTPCFTVSGVLLPLQLTETLCERITSVPPQHGEKYFSAYLGDKQKVPYPYYIPELFRDEATMRPSGLFSIHEDTDAILPRQGSIAFGPNPFGAEPVNDWQAEFISHSGAILGRLPYDDFIERLADREKIEFDQNNYVLRKLSLKRIQEILQN